MDESERMKNQVISKIAGRLLLRLYDRLTYNDPVQSADLIFVMAGRMERKTYGLDLYRAGVAPCLLLSIGRFEISKLGKLNFGSIDELTRLRDRTRPDKRHFFLRLDASGTRIESPRLLRWNTYGEILAFRQFVEKEKVRRIIVISTDVHLRRVRLAFNNIFRSTAIEFLYCWVPPRFEFLVRERWWTRPEDRRFVIKELVKLAGYYVIVFIPEPAIRLLMRFKT